MFYEKTVLDNGITVITEHMQDAHSVALGLLMKVGNRDESPEHYGISHFMEHMLFKGTASRTASDISMAFDAIGADFNAFTSREYTCFYARMMDLHFETAFEVLSDMLVNSKFATEDLDLEREVVIEEIARSEDTPDDLAFDVFSDAVFPVHPLGRPVLGTRETVSKLSHEDMCAYHEQHYTTGNLCVVACGNIVHEQVVATVSRYLSAMRQGETLERASQSERERKSLSCVTKQTEQAHVLYGFPSLKQSDPRRYAYGLLDIALGGSMSSRLWCEIRERRGLAYSVSASSQYYEDAGMFAMYAGSRPENVKQLLDVARGQFELIAEEGVSEDELARVKELACGTYVLSMESPYNHMLRLGRMAITGMPLVSIDETLEKYREVTVDNVNEAAKELFSQVPTIAVVSPYERTDIEGMLI